MPRKKSQIPVYKIEKELGLAEKIQASASINYVTQLQDTKLTQEVAKEFFRSVSSEIDDKQFDLYYLNTILVTTGINLNLDVFDKPEVWAARYTPVDKQFNLEHDQSKIIGHMTSARVVNDKFELINDDVSIDDLPDKFHILTGAVIYRALSDEKAQEEIEKVIDEIEKNEWYVSMECLFRGFDYAITSSTGEQRVLPRNEETAFLTKHLRQYGGSGKYQDFTLGRLLRNITFSGKGLVRKPANPESVIFNESVKAFKAISTNLGYINTSDNSGSRNSKNSVSMESTMAQENENKNDSRIAVLEQQIADLKKLNDELSVKVKESETSATTAKIATLTSDIATKDGQLAKFQEELTSANTKISDLEKNLKDTEKRAEAAEKEINDLKVEKATQDRINILVKNHNAPEDEAKQIVSLFADKNDEQFKVISGLFSDKWKKKDEVVEAKTPEVPANSLEDVKPEVDASLATQNNNNVEVTRASMARFFEENFLGRPPVKTKNGEEL